MHTLMKVRAIVHLGHHSRRRMSIQRRLSLLFSPWSFELIISLLPLSTREPRSIAALDIGIPN